MIPPVIVLCGGFGTRLRPVVEDRPKVLAPILGSPFLDHLLRFLKGQGVSDVVLSTGYLGEMVEAYAGEGDRWGLTVRHAREPRSLGTGGAVRFARDLLELEGPVIVMNGDTFFSGSLEHLLLFHRSHQGAAGTLSLVKVTDAGRYGTVQVDPETGEVERFSEKNTQAGASWINAGRYVLTPELIDSIPPDRNVSIERDVFPGYVRQGLFGCMFPDALFLDIGTPDDYAKAADVLHRF